MLCFHCTHVMSALILQEFVEVTREGFFPFLTTEYDGVLGLGFQDISVGHVTPVWYSFHMI